MEKKRAPRCYARLLDPPAGCTLSEWRNERSVELDQKHMATEVDVSILGLHALHFDHLFCLEVLIRNVQDSAPLLNGAPELGQVDASLGTPVDELLTSVESKRTHTTIQRIRNALVRELEDGT